MTSSQLADDDRAEGFGECQSEMIPSCIPPKHRAVKSLGMVDAPARRRRLRGGCGISCWNLLRPKSIFILPFMSIDGPPSLFV